MRSVLVLLSACLLSSCYQMQWYPGSFTLGPENEIVMSKGMRIEATTKRGPIAIEAGSGTHQRYTWDGEAREVLLAVRKGEPWFGSRGIYSPGDSSFAPVNGVRRAVVEEGWQHFSNKAEFLKWVGERYFPEDVVYTNTGLLVGWNAYPSRYQLNVGVWQITIAGKRPTSLPGANDKAIRVIMPSR